MIFQNIRLSDLFDTNCTIYCFGCGNYFKAFLDEAKQLGAADKIKGIIDNYSSLDIFPDSMFPLPIFKLQDFLSVIKRMENPVIVLTTAYYQEIIPQLDQCQELVHMTYYSYPLMQSLLKAEETTIVGLEERPVIPKKIHYCWFGGKQLPDKDKRYIDGWRKICPDYDIIEWNESNYDVFKNEYMKYAYQDRKWAYVSDYARLDILLAQGGFYFDTDVELLKDLSPLRYHQGFVGTEAAGGIATGLGCGFVKNHPFLKEILKEYEASNCLDMNSKFILRVNADFETEVFRKYGYVKNNQFQLVQNTVIYPFEFFSPLIVGSDILKITDNTYSIHHYHLSWRNDNP